MGGYIGQSVPTAGSRAVVRQGVDEVIDGVKTFQDSPIAPTPDVSDESNTLATTSFVKNKVDAGLATVIGSVVVSAPTITGADQASIGISTTYQFNSIPLLDENVTLSHFMVSFQDGVFQQANATGGSASASFAFTGSTGEVKTVRVYAVDSVGNKSSTVTKNVTLTDNQVPTAPTITAADTASQLTSGNQVTLTGSTDPDGDPLTYSISNQGGLTFSKTSGIVSGEVITFTTPGVTENTPYTFSAVAVDNRGGVSNPTSKTVTVLAGGIVGGEGFGVGVYPGTDLAVMGLSTMTGTTTLGHDNYGNYQHTNGSIMCFIPKFYYRIGNPAAAKFATYGANTVEIVYASAFADTAAANAAGYTLHRAFIDGGVEKSGFFIDKYLASKSGSNAVSVKNGVPISLTTSTLYTNSNGMIANCTGILADAVLLSRARGAGVYNTASVFMYSALAMISLAHGQNATSSTYCAWYDAAGVKNFPKGCNNGSLADVDDTAVTFTTAGDSGTSAKPRTGSASNLAKTTHNGQNSGVVDLNGAMWEVGLGMTSPGYSGTDTTQISNSTVYLLKESVALSYLTYDWNTTTSAWGDATNLSSKYDSFTSPLSLNVSVANKWGNGTNAVFHSEQSGSARALCGVIPKDNNAVNGTGTNQFGLDYIYQYNTTNMFVLFGGYWGNGAFAGVFSRSLADYRSIDSASVSFRSACYGL